MTIPRVLLSDVFGKPHPEALLLLLAEADGPLRHNQARKALGLQPEQFRRALETLETYGLVQLRAVPKKDRPKEDKRPIVLLELTFLGKLAHGLYSEMSEAWTHLVQVHHLNPNVFERRTVLA